MPREAERRRRGDVDDDGENTSSSSQEFEDAGLREEKALSDSEVKVSATAAFPPLFKILIKTVIQGSKTRFAKRPTDGVYLFNPRLDQRLGGAVIIKHRPVLLRNLVLPLFRHVPVAICGQMSRSALKCTGAAMKRAFKGLMVISNEGHVFSFSCRRRRLRTNTRSEAKCRRLEFVRLYPNLRTT